MNLNDLPLNTECYIENLFAKDNLKRRMLDLGLIKGTKIKPVFISPSGDPTAYEVRGSLIAIRKNDAKLIKITL